MGREIELERTTRVEHRQDERRRPYRRDQRPYRPQVEREQRPQYYEQRRYYQRPRWNRRPRWLERRILNENIGIAFNKFFDKKKYPIDIRIDIANEMAQYLLDNLDNVSKNDLEALRDVMIEMKIETE